MAMRNPQLRALPPQRPDRRSLEEYCLALQNLEGRLETRDLLLAALLPLLVCLGLRDARLLDLLQILQHCGQLLLHAREVRGELRDRLVQTGELLRLVLHVLLLGGHCKLVLLRHLFVCLRRGLLIRGHRRKKLFEVRLDHLDEADDGATSALRALTLPVELPQDLQREFHTLEALLHLRTVFVEESLLLFADRVRLLLTRCEVRELFREGSHLPLEELGARLRLVDRGCELINFSLFFIFLSVRLLELFVAIGLVRR